MQRSRAVLAALVMLACAWLLACDATSAPPEVTMPPPPKSVSPRAPVAGSVVADAPPNTTGAAGAAVPMSTPPSPALPSDAGAAPAAGDGDAMAAPDAGRPEAGCLVGNTRVTTCPLPLSRCSGTSTLVFFENARCVDGACTADAKSMRCHSGCNNDSCDSNLTLL